MNYDLAQLKNALAQELPAIEAAIEAEIANLAPIIRPVANHVMKSGGKRFRPMLAILFAKAMNFQGDNLYKLASALEFLHSATLMHDDIMDNAALRRGQPAAHTVFGLAQTILAGDVLLALANEIAAYPKNPNLITSLSQAIMRTATGQIMEIATLRNPNITKAEYLQVITGKTAYLIQAACEAGVIIAEGPEPMQEVARNFGLNLGIAFQLVDDALDYTSSSATSGKPLGGDLREGKYTLPLLLYLETLPRAQQANLIAELSTSSISSTKQDEIINQVCQGGFAQKTRAEAKAYLDLANQALDQLPMSQENILLGAIIKFVLTREN